MNKNESSNSSKQLTNDQRQAILLALYEHYKGGKLERSAIKKVAESFNVNRNYIGQVWKWVNEPIENGCSFMDV